MEKLPNTVVKVHGEGMESKLFPRKLHKDTNSVLREDLVSACQEHIEALVEGMIVHSDGRKVAELDTSAQYYWHLKLVEYTPIPGRTQHYVDLVDGTNPYVYYFSLCDCSGDNITDRRWSNMVKRLQNPEEDIAKTLRCYFRQDAGMPSWIEYPQ
ncbi:hypothetical protein Goe2_c21200 [Bacillus phage vB_BsuM-Goe2]|uniref:Uncharacterized protein n=1 Tax=Bacillus phage vB_BsuM-Goe2 TaxID=1933062 RepID=A0A217EQV9_9CAUD|nr:hypothetical protein Goe2_c01000 [Bacillus phage vB_BsuM-Goe2]APZ82448.1 hypothetical protein Goe2_c21200 [Bacillus phage vB_BsuM-Goe2]